MEKLTKQEIIRAIADLNFWGREQKTGIIRTNYLKHISKFMHTEDALVILGVRRVGKTYLCRQLLKNLIDKVKPEQTLYVNFEDHKLGPYISSTLIDEIYSAYRDFVNKKDFAYIVLDEVHSVPNWENWVRGMQERNENVKIIITGSNARLLKKDISTVLTGRTITFEVFPLSFKEFLEFKNIKMIKKYHRITNKKQLDDLLSEYLKFGAFPKIVLEQDEDVKIQTLKELFDGIINRDIILKNKLREEQSVRIAAELTMSNFSRLISASKLRNILVNIMKTNVSPNFVVKLFHYFEDAFLFFQNPILSYKIKEQKQYPKKTYSIDSGLINATTIRFSEDYGLIYENVVALELFRQYGAENIFYWKNELHEEVDFVIKEGREVKQLIQVCYDIEDEKTKKREKRALIKAAKELKCNNLLIITDNKEQTEKIKQNKINYVTLQNWLLG